MKLLIRYCLILVSCFLLTACGFHLRGHEPLPTQLNTLYIQTDEPYNPFIKQLKQTLQNIGVNVVSDEQDAPITMAILKNTSLQTTTSVGISGQMTTLLLQHSLTYQLLNSHGIPLQAPRTVSTARSYSIATNAVVGNTSAQVTLEDEMQRDLIFQLFNQLRSSTTLQAISRP
jgi:LPS-assembly lipoprotein